MAFLSVVVLFFTLQSIESAANNNLSYCNALANQFLSNCNGPVSNISSIIGTPVSCNSSFNASTCPGTFNSTSDTCVFYSKVCVTCFVNSTVRIRVQSNGLPKFCPNALGRIIEQNIDFEVNFNPDVNVNAPIHDPANQATLNGIVCNVNSHSSVPHISNYKYNYNSSLLSMIAGVSIDGVPILNANSANNGDPYYPVGTSVIESIDTCLGHRDSVNGAYHYHAASSCSLKPSNSSIRICETVPGCNGSLSNYSISSFSSYRNLTVIGIAKDGHIIYGPYDSNGKEITSGFDICNGMFHDATGNYGYFATRTYPYMIGCFGPGNYPSFRPNCTANAPISYTKSSYARNLTIASSTSTVMKCNITIFSTILFFTMSSILT